MSKNVANKCDSWLAEFKAPVSAMRAKPFWAWNGNMDPDELRRQIRVFKQMGLGGFFMHSRVGLDTAYLSKEWFDCIRACIDEAKQQDMEAWLYDEDRWPSGGAGGIVTKDERFRQRFLKLTRYTDASVKTFRWTDRTVGAFTARLDGFDARDVAAVKRNTKPKLAPGQTLLAFDVQLAELNPWFNGYTYLDTLNPQGVKQFIKVTHEAYRREVGDDFGKYVPGIFTDEPCHTWPGESQAAWTDRLPDIFQRQYKYDLLDHLVELFFRVDGQTLSKARVDFNDCVTELFVQSFARPIGEWCEKNSIAFTGHIMAEDTLGDQTGFSGQPMRFYEFMQAPGMDLLTEHWRNYLTAKQVTSAARQFGRTWRLTETDGCSGWDFSFEGHKATGDWQAAMGINLRCPHLSWYTMLGEAKRDYPASIFYQSPWWEQYGLVETYFGRVNAVMTRGVEVRDLLVIHPAESAWAVWHPQWRQDASFVAYQDRFDDDLRALLSAGLDFDLGDEALLAKYGAVRGGSKAGKGKASKSSDPAVLTVGKATYRAVLVPSLKTIRSSTLELLVKFRAAGGLVVFTGESPAAVDAEPCECAAKFAAAGPAFGEVNQAVATLAPAARRVDVVDAASGKIIPESLYLLREDKDATYLLVVNTSLVPGGWQKDPLVRDRGAAYNDVEIRVRVEGLPAATAAKCAPVELDPATGEMFAADATFNGLWQVKTSLPRIGSRLFVFPHKPCDCSPQARVTRREVSATPINPAAWDLALDEDNVLVLDRAKFRVAAGGWQAEQEILRVDGAVRDALKIARRGGGMVQPWAQDKSIRYKTTPVTLEYEFDVRVLPAGPLRFGIEKPELYRIAVNGQPINTDGANGFWTDRSLVTLPVDNSLLRVGKNTLTLETAYSQLHPGFEIVYLLGHFGASAEGCRGAVVAPPTQLHLGDWCPQGLPFYGGNVGYRTSIGPVLADGQRLVIRVGQYRGIAVRVLVAGRVAGTLGWDPLELDITDALAAARQTQAGAAGPVELTLQVLGHRRNSHGPLHHAEKWPTWTGPGEFVVTGDQWREDFNLVPAGLMTPPQLVVME